MQRQQAGGRGLPRQVQAHRSRSSIHHAYESDGDTLTATATGDLDCDGTQIVYKFELKRTPDGTGSANVTEPPLSAD
jgi:hypothetical protein